MTGQQQSRISNILELGRKGREERPFCFFRSKISAHPIVACLGCPEGKYSPNYGVSHDSSKLNASERRIPPVMMAKTAETTPIATNGKLPHLTSSPAAQLES